MMSKCACKIMLSKWASKKLANDQLPQVSAEAQKMRSPAHRMAIRKQIDTIDDVAIKPQLESEFKKKYVPSGVVGAGVGGLHKQMKDYADNNTPQAKARAAAKRNPQLAKL